MTTTEEEPTTTAEAAWATHKPWYARPVAWIAAAAVVLAGVGGGVAVKAHADAVSRDKAVEALHTAITDANAALPTLQDALDAARAADTAGLLPATTAAQSGAQSGDAAQSSAHSGGTVDATVTQIDAGLYEAATDALAALTTAQTNATHLADQTGAADSQPVSVETITMAATALDEATTQATKAATVLTANVTAAVLASATARYDEGLADLTKAVSEAEKTLTDSKGKVADSATRKDLKAVITTAKALLTTDHTTGDTPQSGASAQSGAQSGDAVWTATDYDAHAGALTGAVADLKTARKAVNDSMKAKEKADAEAAAQAAAEQEAAAAETNGGGSSYDSDYAGSGYDSDYTGGGYDSGGSTSGGYVPQSSECDPRWPCYSYDDDGWQHHQIQPDSNGSYTDGISGNDELW